jgi:type VI protein secretion system component VasK
MNAGSHAALNERRVALRYLLFVVVVLGVVAVLMIFARVGRSLELGAIDFGALFLRELLVALLLTGGVACTNVRARAVAVVIACKRRQRERTQAECQYSDAGSRFHCCLQS